MKKKLRYCEPSLHYYRIVSQTCVDGSSASGTITRNDAEGSTMCVPGGAAVNTDSTRTLAESYKASGYTDLCFDGGGNDAPGIAIYNGACATGSHYDANSCQLGSAAQ